MNRIFSKRLVFFSILIFIWSGVSAQSFLGSVKQNVNLREGPGKEYDVLMTLQKGAQVFISWILPEDGYYTIIEIASNTPGYVHKDFIVIGEALPENKEGIFNPTERI